MIQDPWMTAVATCLAAAGATGLYAASPHQALFSTRRKPPVRVLGGLLLLLGGAVMFTLGWGAPVAALLVLAVWMTVSVALPYLAIWRAR